MSLGVSGNLTRSMIGSPLTPLFLIAALALGLMALFSIPREEEPQISVPMVDIMVAAPGLAVEFVTPSAAVNRIASSNAQVILILVAVSLP